jgi:hypothetical protein
MSITSEDEWKYTTSQLNPEARKHLAAMLTDIGF